MTRIFTLSATAALLALTFGLGGCSSSEPDATGDAAKPRTVRFVTVESRVLESGIAASGKLVAREEAAVAPQLSGYQIARVLVDLDDWVKAGQVLAVLDDTLLRSDIMQQQANVAQARVEAERTEQQAARVAGLDASGVLSTEAIAERRLAAKTARAQLRQAEAQLEGQQVRYRLMTIRAPVSGRILERSARPGDVASPSSIMFRIARDGLVELDAEVPEQSLGLIRIGEPATVTLPTGARATGHVRLISAEVDAQTRLGRARILLPARTDLRVGGFAQAVLQASAVPVNAIREGAISYSADGPTVTVIGKDNRVSEREVKLGRRGGGYVELVEGPSRGTRLLLGAQGFVLDGDKVNPTPAPTGKAR